MQGEGLGVEIVPDASHLYCELSVSRTSVCVGRPQEGNWIVPFLHNQHSDYFLVAIYNEITTKLIRILVCFDELLLIQSCQMAIVRSYHNWNLTQRSCECVN